MTTVPGWTAMLVTVPVHAVKETPMLVALDTLPLADTVEEMSPVVTVVVCRVAAAVEDV